MQGHRVSVVAASIASIALIGCGGCGAQPQDLVHSISLDAADDSDLEFLRELVEGKRIVQLGEAGHGVGEFSRIKVRMVEFLHRKLGFGVLAFEGSPYQCFLADRNAATWPPRTTLFSCPFGVWHTEEVLPLFEYIHTIGVYAYSGSATNNSGEVYEIAEPGAATLEGVMHALGRDAVFIDLSRARRDDATAWMFEAIAARYNGTEEIRLVPRDQYDGLLLVQTATPRKPLE